jgi:hypothetical protein
MMTTMTTIEEIEAERERVLDEMRQIRSLRRGSVNEQYFTKRRPGRAQPVKQGPYYVFTRSEGGKTKSYRLKKGEEVEQARQDVAAHKRFKELVRRYEELTERLGAALRSAEESAPEKKRLKSPSKPTGKSN